LFDGPFTEAKEVVGGYWLIEVKSKEEAVEWAKREPLRRRPRGRGPAGLRDGRLPFRNSRQGTLLLGRAAASRFRGSL